MGTGSSRPTGSVGPGEMTYAALIKVQERDNVRFGRIFKRMLENIAPKDLRELYSISQCRKYHFALGNALAKLFYFTPIHGMGAQPVYWLRIDSHQAHHQDDPAFFKNCFQVGYFYIRLIQIFCALSLTAKSNETVPYSEIPYGGPVAQYFRFPGMGGGKDDDIFGLTGDLDDIFKDYIKDDGVFKRANYMKLKGDKIYISHEKYKIVFDVKHKSVYNNHILHLSNFEVNDTTLDIDKKIQIKKNFNDVYVVKDKNNTSLVEHINNMINEIIASLKNKKSISGPPQQERKELRIDNLIERLTGSEHKPYAIARALQLIDLSPQESYGGVKRTYEFTSHVFDFSYSSIIGNAPAILSDSQLKAAPEKTSTLANVNGLSALEKLYYDNWKNLTYIEREGKVVESESYRFLPEKPAEYEKFLKRIQCMYKSTSIKPVQLDSKSSLRSLHVKNTYPKSGPVRLFLDSERDKAVINALQKLQRQLFALQASQVMLVRKFVDEFIIRDTPKGPMPNPRIFKEGLNYINAVGEKAREFLLTYYEKAEAIYYAGYSLIRKIERKDESFPAFMEGC
jgi:hypothetical protein